MKRLCLAAVLSLLAFDASAAEPIILQARTAADLAALCMAEPGIPGADAKINFCHGFAQGAIDDRLLTAGEAKPFCFPTPRPGRTATLREFATWVHAAPEHKDLPAPQGLIRFMAARFPCKAP